jgi:hypothetical protein
MSMVISERALFARVARNLAHNGETLHRCRVDSRWFNSLGRYYTVDSSTGCAGSRCDDVEDLLVWAIDLEVVAHDCQVAVQ